MGKWKIGSRIWGLLAASWLVAGGSGIFVVQHVRSTYEGLFAHETHDQDLSRQMQVTFKKQVQEWKDLLLRGYQADAMKSHTAGFHAQEQQVQDLGSQLVADLTDPDAKAVVQSFLAAHRELSAAYGNGMEVFTKGVGGNPHEVDALLKGKDRKPTDLIDQVVTLLGKRVEQKRAAVIHQLAVVAMAAAVCFAALIFFSALTIRTMNRVLRESVRSLSDSTTQVAAAAQQIAATSQSASQGAVEQAASIEEISSGVEEIAAMTKSNAEHSVAAASMMAETVVDVDRSGKALREMTDSMGAIQGSSEKVAKVTRTIHEIAFQTNILALNAAVEAARAGEAGVGFAVVAEAVRDLAQRSSRAAAETADLIQEAMENSKRGSASLDAVAATITTITDRAAAVSRLVEQVRQASSEQARGIQQVAASMSQIRTTTESAAANAEEGAASAEELSAQSQTVSDLCAQLSELVEGAAAGR